MTFILSATDSAGVCIPNERPLAATAAAARCRAPCAAGSPGKRNTASIHVPSKFASYYHDAPLSPIVAVVSTSPGLNETTTKPSSLSLSAHLLVATSLAAFVVPYAAMSTIPAARTNFGSDLPELMRTIFLEVEARSKGRKAVMLWIMQRTFTLYYVDR